MTKPTIEEVAEYGGPDFPAEAFLNYYDMVGWVVGAGRKPMKDWKAAVRYWKMRDRSKKTDDRLRSLMENI